MKNKKELIIIGVGETAQLAYEYFKYDSEYSVKAFLANKKYIKNEYFCGLPVHDLDKATELYDPNHYDLFVAIAAGKLNRDRTNIYQKLKLMGYKFASYISSNAFIWHNVVVGENCFILENNTLQPFVNIGNNVILWSGNHIGHRSIIEDNCFISSHCVISGYCKIKRNSFLGVNCTVENNSTIESDNFIGANALIRKKTNINEFYQNNMTPLASIDSLRLMKVDI